MTEKITMPSQKTIALVAHDNQKKTLVEWCIKNKEILKGHFLCGTGTSARLVAEATGLPVKCFKSGPLGGDQQLGAKIVDGDIDMLIFFSDPLEAQPHDPDIKALLRISTLYDIPIANNKASADFIITSRFMSSEYIHEQMDYVRIAQERATDMAKETIPESRVSQR
ncbi:MAG: methylglyoxal synthase [Anaerovoracaceae bacterium]